MFLQQLSGIVISLGFLMYVAAMLVAPRLYQEVIIANRLAIIASSQARWNISQLFFALGAGIPAAGFILLAFSKRALPSAWLYYLGAAAFGAGSLLAMWLIYTQTMDPAAFWEESRISLIIGYALILTLVGMLGLGIALLQGGFPRWLGYLMGGTAVPLLIITLISRGQGGFFISILTYLITFVAGIVIWRQ